MKLFVCLAMAVLMASSPASALSGNRVILQVAGPDGSGPWLPSKAQAVEAEAALRDFSAHPEADKLSWSLSRSSKMFRFALAGKLEGYVLQFAGVRRGQGDRTEADAGTGPRVIRISGFCNWPGPAMLATREVIEADGGTCYFRAIYDLDLKAITYFAVNGLA